MSLALIGDLALAGESSRFTMAYSRIGLTPDGSSTYFLPRLVGLRRSLELCLTNRMLSSQEALDWGMINRVVPDEDLQSEAHTLAAQLAAGPTESIGAAKRLYHKSWNEGLETQMEWETREICDAARRPEGQGRHDRILREARSCVPLTVQSLTLALSHKERELTHRSARSVPLSPRERVRVRASGLPFDDRR